MPVGATSAVFLVTKVNPWCSAVAASCASMVGSIRRRALARAPELFATKADALLTAKEGGGESAADRTKIPERLLAHAEDSPDQDKRSMARAAIGRR